MQVLRWIAISAIVVSAMVILSSSISPLQSFNNETSSSETNQNGLQGHNTLPSLSTHNPPSPGPIKLLNTIPLGFDGPIEPVVDTFNGRVYVPMNGQDGVTVTNGSNDGIIANISVPQPPVGAAFDSWNGNVYVASNGIISVINSTTDRVDENMVGAAYPMYIAFDSNNGYLYETTSNSVSTPYGYLTVINAETGNAVANTALQDPYGLAVDYQNGRIFVADQGLQGVYVISDKTQQVVAQLNLKLDVTGATFDSTNGNIYVTGGEQVTEINGTTDSVTSVFSVPSYTFMITYDSINNDLYVSVSQGNLAILNSSTGTVLKQIGISTGQPTDVAFDVSDNVIYLCSPAYSITVVNGSTNEIKVILDPGKYPGHIGFDRSNGQLYIAEPAVNQVAVVNGSTNQYTGAFYNGGQPTGVAADTMNDTLYIGDSFSNIVTVVNASDYSYVKEFIVGTSPQGVVYDKLNACMYVMNMDSGNVTVINTTNNSDVKSINVGGYTNPNEAPNLGALDYMNNNLYFTNTYHDSVTVISTTKNTEVGNINVGNETSGIAYDSWNGYLYVSSPDSNRVAVINGNNNSVADYINVGNSPSSVAFDSFNGYIFVANSGSGNVSVINGATESVVADIQVGENPDGMAFDTLNGYIYVSNQDTNTVSVIGYPSQNVTFVESGLMSGDWYVNITGSEITSSGPISGAYYHLMLPAGNYHYDLSTDDPMFAPANSSANFSVISSPVNETVNFIKVAAPANNLRTIFLVSASVVVIAAVAGALYVSKRRKG